MEAIYNFPIDEAAAVCGFQAEYEDGRIVKGVVKEKNQARQEFNQAISRGKQANLMELVRRDVFSLRVGNLPAGAYVKITITYVTALKARDGAAAFILPTYIAPRYCPDTTADLRLAGTSMGLQLFGMSIGANFTCLSNIKSIQCSTHELTASLSSNVRGKTGHIQLEDVTMDRDLVLLVSEDQAHQPRAVVERSPSGLMAGLVTIFPDLEFKDRKREITFLIDRSGSMHGSQMEQARETLQLFLRSLPVSCRFNIVGFGSTYSALFSSEGGVPYNDYNLEQATSYAQGMQANMGGTEIKTPLEFIFGQPRSPHCERQVFVLTDGQVSNDQEVFKVIRRYCTNGNCRLFSVGVGRGVSRHLVEGMARYAIPQLPLIGCDESMLCFTMFVTPALSLPFSYA